MTTPDARVCERVTRQHARTFFLASHFLPERKRRAAFAVYAFCRVADDIVDAAEATDVSPSSSVPETSLDGRGDDGSALSLKNVRGAVVPSPIQLLAAYREQLRAALAGNAEGPVLREAAWAVHEFGVPDHVLYELVDGVGRDLQPVRYETWKELETYCEGVASTVGVMCAHIFGVDDDRHRDTAMTYARTLGVAMQLTNVLRDVGEDAQRGRCYLPDAELHTFGIERTEVFENASLAHDSRWKHFMQFEIARARQLYAEAYPGIAMLAHDAQRCAAACAIGYASILRAIEQTHFDSLNQRTHVSVARKLGILWEAWRYNTTSEHKVPTAFAT